MGIALDEAERLVRMLDFEDERVIAALDERRLAKENAGRKSVGSEPLYGVLNCLRLWEYLVRRMENGWDGPYMVYEYLNVLGVRNAIGEFLDAMPDGTRTKVDGCVGRLDARYRAVTRDDGGAELAQYWRSLREGRETRWWWTRRPVDLPPGW